MPHQKTKRPCSYSLYIHEPFFCLLNYNFIFEMLKNNRGVRVFFTLERFTYVKTFALMLTSFARWSLPKEEERHRKKTILFPLWSVAVHKRWHWQGAFARVKYFWGIAHTFIYRGVWTCLWRTETNQLSTTSFVIRGKLGIQTKNCLIAPPPSPPLNPRCLFFVTQVCLLVRSVC